VPREFVVLLVFYDNGVLIKGDLSKVISPSYNSVIAIFILDFTMTSIYGIDVCSIFCASPDFLHGESYHTCPGEPVSVLESRTTSRHLVPSSNIPE
jgi:hypothetical protein